MMDQQKPKLEIPVNQGDADIKKKPTRKRYDIPKTVQCHICGDLAAEHLHYGGIACYSCRAFFRRTVNSSRPMLDCANDNNCNITKETRKRCQSCRFEKCKGVGMKPSWVLSENDRSKLALRKVESPSEDQNIETSIKQEPAAHIAHALSILNDGSFIKKRHPSSPVASPVSPPVMFKSSLLSPSYQPMQSPHSPHPYSSSPDPISPPPYFNVPFITNHTHPTNQIQNAPMQNDPYRGQSNNVKNEARNESKIEQKPDMFNKMQVSFMGPSDGLSFTIEAHREAHSAKTEPIQTHHQNATSKNQFNMDEKLNWRQEGFHPNMSTNNNLRYENGHQEGLSRVQLDRGFGSGNSDGSVNMNPRQHENTLSESDYRGGGQTGSNFSLQLENNISPDTMVFMPNQQNQRHVQRQPQPDHQGFQNSDVDQPKKFKSHHQHTRTIFRCISPGSASSENGDNEEKEIPHPEDLTYTTGQQVRAPRIWKLSEPPPISPTMGTKSQFGITLEESVFVAQLNAIEDRVRCQVPMDVDHGRAFLECALLANPVSQSTIMHAYQTCIKRIVRFANSLQDFVELPPDDMQRLLVRNTVSIINIRIARWLHPKTSLKTQMALFWTGVDLYNEASECFDQSQMENKRVNSWEVFVSPWCCDSAYEDRYNNLLQLIYNLVIDNTTVVLLSVMCLFDADASTGVHTTGVIKSHARKFSLLLQRYLIEKIGKEDAIATFPKFTLALAQLKEMADILVNRRLIC